MVFFRFGVPPQLLSACPHLCPNPSAEPPHIAGSRGLDKGHVHLYARLPLIGEQLCTPYFQLY